jgi:hypothetical protein
MSMRRRGRPPQPIAEALAFFELVERERRPGIKLEQAFTIVRRRDSRRWKSMPTMWRLWRRTSILR